VINGQLVDVEFVAADAHNPRGESRCPLSGRRAFFVEARFLDVEGILPFSGKIAGSLRVTGLASRATRRVNPPHYVKVRTKAGILSPGSQPVFPGQARPISSAPLTAGHLSPGLARSFGRHVRVHHLADTALLRGLFQADSRRKNLFISLLHGRFSLRGHQHCLWSARRTWDLEP